MDAKGRINMPQKHRDTLQSQCAGTLTLTKHPSGCVLVFPRPVWEEHRVHIAAWPMAARPWQRIFLGFASDVELDAAGRMLVPPELRIAGSLQKDVMLLGMGSHFELWDAALLCREEAQAVAQGLPEALSQFCF
jgi:MraZ protein